MKVYTYVRIDIETGKTIEEESFEYSGPVALCWGDDDPADPDDLDMGFDSGMPGDFEFYSRAESPQYDPATAHRSDPQAMADYYAQARNQNFLDRYGWKDLALAPMRGIAGNLVSAISKGIKTEKEMRDNYPEMASYFDQVYGSDWGLAFQRDPGSYGNEPRLSGESLTQGIAADSGTGETKLSDDPEVDGYFKRYPDAEAAFQAAKKANPKWTREAWAKANYQERLKTDPSATWGPYKPGEEGGKVHEAPTSQSPTADEYYNRYNPQGGAGYQSGYIDNTGKYVSAGYGQSGGASALVNPTTGAPGIGNLPQGPMDEVRINQLMKSVQGADAGLTLGVNINYGDASISPEQRAADEAKIASAIQNNQETGGQADNPYSGINDNIWNMYNRGYGDITQGRDLGLQDIQNALAAGRGDIERGVATGRGDLEKYFDIGTGYYQPYREAGTNALSTLQTMMTAGPGQFTESPGYQFRLGEGTKAMERAASARGGTGALFDPRLYKELGEYGQGMASDEYQKFIDRYYQSLTPYQQMVQGLACPPLEHRLTWHRQPEQTFQTWHFRGANLWPICQSGREDKTP